MNREDILSTLAGLDAENDDHWTKDGMPLIAALGFKLGEVKRKDITEAAPNFTRETMNLGEAPLDPPKDEDTSPEDEERKLEDLEGKELDEFTENLEQLNVGVEDLIAQRKDLEERLAAIGVEVEKARVARQKVSDELDQVITALGSQGTLTLAQQLDLYRKSQKKVRATRVLKAHAASQALANVGLEPKSLMSGTPLDESMRKRKPGRGSQRPNYPVKTE